MASNMFEGLVPTKGTGATSPAAANMFEDLIPQKAEEPKAREEPISLRDRALNSLPPDLREYARKALSPADFGWQHNAPSYSPLKPADPNNMPNDAINPVGTDAQMAAATAAAGGLSALARTAPGTSSVVSQVPRVNMAQMPTQQSFGAQMAQNTGGGAMPINPPPLPPGALQAAGNAAQAGLLGQVAKSFGGAMAGSAAHTAAGYLPFPFNAGAHAGLKVVGL